MASRNLPVCDARGEDLPRQDGRLPVLPLSETKGAKMTWLKIYLKKNENDGFTLVEIMVVLAIIALVATFTVPGYLLAQKKQLGHACRDNLMAIEQAKRDYITDNAGALPPADENDPNGIRRYLFNGVLPTCPAGGAYENTTDPRVRCTCPNNFSAGKKKNPWEIDTPGVDKTKNGYHDLGY